MNTNYRTDRVSPARVPAPLSMDTHSSCAHFDCTRPATDERHGWRLCMGHFFQALQFDARRQDVAA